MPREHKHIPFSIYEGISGHFFLEVFLELDCNGKTDRCAVLGCNSDRLFLWKTIFLILSEYIGNPRSYL